MSAPLMVHVSRLFESKLEVLTSPESAITDSIEKAVPPDSTKSKN